MIKKSFLINMILTLTIKLIAQEAIAMDFDILESYDLLLNGPGVAHEGQLYFMGTAKPYIFNPFSSEIKPFPDKVKEFKFSSSVGVIFTYKDPRNTYDFFKTYNPTSKLINPIDSHYTNSRRLSLFIIPSKFTYVANVIPNNSFPSETKYKITKYITGWNDIKIIFKETYYKPLDFSDDKNLFLLASSGDLILLDTITDETVGKNKNVYAFNTPAYARFINNQYGLTTYPDGSFMIFDMQGKSKSLFRFSGTKGIDQMWIDPSMKKALVQFPGQKAKVIDCSAIHDYFDNKGWIYYPQKAVVLKDTPVLEFANYMAHEGETKFKKGDGILLVDKSSVQREFEDKTDYYYKIEIDETPGWIHGSLLNIEQSEKQNQAKPEKTVTPPQPLHIKKLTVTSALTEPKDKDAYHPVKAFDSTPKTMWIEAAKDPGLGEYLEVELSQPITIDRIEIQPGCF